MYAITPILMRKRQEMQILCNIKAIQFNYYERRFNFTTKQYITWHLNQIILHKTSRMN